LIQAEAYVDIFTDYYFSGRESTFGDDFLEQSLFRVAHLDALSRIIELTPSSVPYWNGETYLPLFTKFIPRFLWPEKPEERLGQEFGHRYGILDQTDSVTSVNLPWISEMYANFGPTGVILGMALVGVLLRYLEMKFNRKRMNILQAVFGLTVMLPLFYQESNLSLMVGGILLQVIVFYWLFRLFR